MLAQLRAQKKAQKENAAQKKFNPEEDLNWSDEESDWHVKIPERKVPSRAGDTSEEASRVGSRSNSRPSSAGYRVSTVEQPKLIEPKVKKLDITRSRLNGFKGDSKSSDLEILENQKKVLTAQYNFKIPLPYIPAHIVESLGIECVYFLWDQFLQHDVDASELIKFKYLSDIFSNFETYMNLPPGHCLLKFNPVDGDDYVEFRDVVTQLSAKVCAIPPTVAPPKLDLAICCCAMNSCRIHGYSKEVAKVKSNYVLAKETDQSDDHVTDAVMGRFSLFVVYQRWKLKFKGKVRVRHIPSILDEATVKYDPEELPEAYFELYRDFVVPNFPQLAHIVCRVCNINCVIPDLYRIPHWLQQSYNPWILNYYRQKFISADSDGHGKINPQQMKLLFKALGCKVQESQTRVWINKFGTEDGLHQPRYMQFGHFMALLYKFEKRVENPLHHEISKMLYEAHQHAVTFEDIISIQEDPEATVKVLNFSFLPGYPVVAEFLIMGAVNTPYQGAMFPLRITFQKGYPFKCPDVVFNCRVFAVNLLINTDGTSTLPHIKENWDRTWSLRKLLAHIDEDVFTNPTFDYVNPRLVHIARYWSQDILQERKMKEAEAKEEAEAELERQRKQEENTANIVAALRAKQTGSDAGGGSAGPVVAEKATGEVGEGSTVSNVSEGGAAPAANGEGGDGQASIGDEEPVEEEPEEVEEEEEELIDWFDWEEELDTFPRVTQMHVNVLALFLTDKPRYDTTVTEYVNKYAILIPPDPVEEVEGEGELASDAGSKGWETMDENYFYDPNAEPEEDVNAGTPYEGEVVVDSVGVGAELGAPEGSFENEMKVGEGPNISNNNIQENSTELSAFSA